MRVHTNRGTVDLSELYRVMVEESGIACNRSELEELWDLFDRDRDGSTPPPPPSPPFRA